MTTPKSLTDPERALWHALKHTAEDVRRRVADEITAATGLSDPDYGVVTRLADAPGEALRQQELADSMGWHRSRLSHHLTRMEARGLVTREGSPGAGVVVRLTQAGQQAADAARPVHAAAVRRHLTGRLSAEERRDLLALLEALAPA